VSSRSVILWLGLPFLAFSVDRGRLVVNSSLVLINATVADRQGHLVSGLQRANFRLFDGNREEKVVSVSQEDGPISVGIVFDASGSMRDYLPLARKALQTFIAASGRNDEYAAVLVRDHPDWALHFTRDSDAVLTQLAAVEADGSTALVDSIYLAVQGMRSAHNPRKALLVISDGMDNHSRYADSELKHLLEESNVTVFAVGVWRAYPEAEAEIGRSLLKELSESTGGRYLEANSPRDLAKKFGELDLRFEYMIAFRVEDISLDGKFHPVTLKVVPSPNAPRLYANWRRGYYAAK